MENLDWPKTLQLDFYKGQYEGLRREIELTLSEARSVERYAALATAAIWAWLATNGTPAGYGWCWYIPVALPILGGLRSYAIVRHFGLLGRYVRFFEGEVCHSDLPGWETFIRNPAKYVKDPPSKWQRHWISRTGAIFWVGLLVATVVIGFLGHRWPPKVPSAGLSITCK
jgi:hypothetical protein